jgi:hypothetical protein
LPFCAGRALDGEKGSAMHGRVMHRSKRMAALFKVSNSKFFEWLKNAAPLSLFTHISSSSPPSSLLLLVQGSDKAT